MNKTQIGPVAEMLARAFQDDPLFIYFIPDAAERESKLPHFFRPLVRHGIVHGESYATSPDLEGVATWLPSEKDGIWSLLRSGALSLLPQMGKTVINRMWRFNRYTAAIHRPHMPSRYWYLQYVAVESALRGKGYAGILLKPMLTRIGQEHLPCYLGTQNERNVPLYQHHGFKIVEEFATPGTSFSSWFMSWDQEIAGRIREAPGQLL